MSVFSDLETYPEFKTWTLINLFTGEERLVTDAMLEQAFTDESELMKIKSGRSKAWSLIENFNDLTASNASQILY
jgi:hypothetical protein